MAIGSEQMLPVVHVAELPSDEIAERWLVEQLWCANSVGVIGGAPSAQDVVGAGHSPVSSHGHSVSRQVQRSRAGAGHGVLWPRDAVSGQVQRSDGMARHRGLDLAEDGNPGRSPRLCCGSTGADRTRLWETARRLSASVAALRSMVITVPVTATRPRTGPHAALWRQPGDFGLACWCWIPW